MAITQRGTMELTRESRNVPEAAAHGAWEHHMLTHEDRGQQQLDWKTWELHWEPRLEYANSPIMRMAAVARVLEQRSFKSQGGMCFACGGLEPTKRHRCWDCALHTQVEATQAASEAEGEAILKKG